MMSNVQGILRGIFGILFLFSMVSAAFAQQEQQPDAALSQSQFMQLIDRIDKVKKEINENMDKKFENVNKKFENVDKKFEELDTKIDKLSEDVAFINGQLSIIKWSITIFGAPLLVALIVYYFQNRKKTDVTAEVATQNREKSQENLIEENVNGVNVYRSMII